MYEAIHTDDISDTITVCTFLIPLCVYVGGCVCMCVYGLFVCVCVCVCACVWIMDEAIHTVNISDTITACTFLIPLCLRQNSTNLTAENSPYWTLEEGRHMSF